MGNFQFLLMVLHVLVFSDKSCDNTDSADIDKNLCVLDSSAAESDCCRPM